MKMQNGEHGSKKKSKSSGGFIKDTFIISKNDTAQRKTGKIISIIALVLIVASIVLGGLMISKYVIAKINNDNMEDLIPTSEVSSDAGVSGTDGEGVIAPTPDEFDKDGILLGLSDLYQLNNEVIGWINIPGTKLDYPVAKRPNNEDPKIANGYYLNHTLEKKINPFGTPFSDYRATFANGYQSANVTIYGHNSKSGDFFETVKYYKDIEFYKENPIINFDTIYGKGQYKVIGRFTEFVDPNQPFFAYHDFVDFNPNAADAVQNAEAQARHNEFMTELGKRNYYESGVDVKFGDNFITLSTCNDEIQGAQDTPYRDVLVARKVRPGEDATVDVSKIQKNTDVIMPAGWIKKFGKENPYK
ncbi:MAG: class B sortase [Oscillospiraceae bacterium]